MFTHCLQIFSSRSLLWTKLREDDVRRLKAGEKNCRKENDCTAREQNWLPGKQSMGQMQTGGQGMSPINGENGRRRILACFLNSIVETAATLPGGNGVLCADQDQRRAIEIVGNNAYSALRVIGDSLSDKFNFRLITDESGVFPRGSMIGGS